MSRKNVLFSAPFAKSFSRQLVVRRPLLVARRRKPRLTSRVRKLEAASEKKVLDTTVELGAPADTGLITQLTNVAQGLTDVLRLGNKIMIVGIHLKYQVSSNISSSIRVMIVQDKQTNGAIYTTGELLQDATNNNAVISLLNKDQRRRFRVIYDKFHSFSLNGTAVAFANKFIKVNIPVRYDANVGDITDLQSNSLSLMSIAGIAGAGVDITFQVRLFFTDS